MILLEKNLRKKKFKNGSKKEDMLGYKNGKSL
jgi:hypothetical protein